ncbi:MAG TPA: PIN domain-containing protein [Verrucomicrobiae bacterium]|nr:PIN domain-containing protein [Verrucomicrobiae bacterium]
MKYLLDTNALLAAILTVHPSHALTDSWISQRALASCPLSELGFLRISTHPRAYNVGMALARQSLEAFLDAHKVEPIADDLPALKSKARRTEEVTDCYLADLAAAKGMKLATLDTGITHPAAELIR